MRSCPPLRCSSRTMPKARARHKVSSRRASAGWHGSLVRRGRGLPRRPPGAARPQRSPAAAPPAGSCGGRLLPNRAGTDGLRRRRPGVSVNWRSREERDWGHHSGVPAGRRRSSRARGTEAAPRAALARGTVTLQRGETDTSLAACGPKKRSRWIQYRGRRTLKC